MCADLCDLLRAEALGSVRAWLGGTELDLGPPRQRTVFAVLAFRASQVVSRGELIDAVWGENPPDSAQNGVYTYIKGLRRALEPARPPRAPSRLLASAASGYELRMAPHNLDATVFGRRLRCAREQHDAGDLARAAQSLDSALLLWQASPLLGVVGPWAETERARLSELRLSAIEERTEIMLARGRHAEVAAQLTRLVREHPLRERFHAQLMMALYRCGRQAEALAVFVGARRALVDELGIEPGAELRALHARILAADPALDAVGSGTGLANVIPARPPADEHRASKRAASPAAAEPGTAGPGRPGVGPGSPGNTGSPAARGFRRPRLPGRVRVLLAVVLIGGPAVTAAVLAAWPGRPGPGLRAGARPSAAGRPAAGTPWPGTSLYSATIAADCPHLPGTSAFAYDPAPPEWSVGTVGGWSGGGCYGEFFYQAQSSTAAPSPDYVRWTAKRIPAAHTRCSISIYIARSPHSAGVAHYYISTLDNGAPNVIGQLLVDQRRHRGDWVGTGPYQIVGGWLQVDVHAQDPHRREITADAINLDCPAN